MDKTREKTLEYCSARIITTLSRWYNQKRARFSNEVFQTRTMLRINGTNWLLTISHNTRTNTNFRINTIGEVEDSRLSGQSQGYRHQWPRTQKKSEAKAKDNPSKDRPSRGQGEECWGQGQGHNAEVIYKKKVFAPKFCKFSGNLSVLQEKKCLQKLFCKLSGVFQKDTKLVMTLAHFNKSKNSAVLEPRTGQFRGLAGFEAKAKDFKLCPRRRLRS